ncbi:MAG: DeoR/GlpR transcriptional regulator [Spirochaetales bacterium]|nr:DeoR/GlpR transcriptional regulator [Spirochaetales bacterium]
MYIARHEQILKILSLLREVSVPELSDRLAVSEVTIRKDLSTLEETGCLFRTHGGARIAEDFRLIKTIDIRQRENLPAKQALAAKAKELLSNGDTVYLDSGSTCLMIAREIRDLNLHVVTNSIDIMADLSGAQHIILHSLGGSYRKESGAFIGPAAVTNLKEFQFSICFLGTTGFSEQGVFSSQNIIESEMKRQALVNSTRRVVAADSSKFGISAFSIFARPGDIDILVTDDKFSGTSAAALAELGIETIKGLIS